MRFQALLPRSKPNAMNARAVNVAILLLLAFELATGLGSFLVGAPGGRWLFWLHRAGGLALIVLLASKVGIAVRSYHRRGLRVSTGLSALGGCSLPRVARDGAALGHCGVAADF